ncbi:uncharacterized protein LOC142167957 [Nicotiana tabacum]|uniref:Uncharacterized protein LOC142167957 n=1 Tax=Nicotiana tabacum TaxID=4097 RepID=A0AC58SI90_TOBAC
MRAGNTDFRRTFRSMLDYHKPNVVALLETRLADHHNIMEDFEFSGIAQVPTQGNSGGMTLVWNIDEVNVDQIGGANQEIHAMVKVNNFPKVWLCSVIYASSLLEERLIIWNNLKTVANNLKRPWLVLGDFNEVTRASEKFEGLHVSINRISKFIDYLDHCKLVDLGFKGPKYT